MHYIPSPLRGPLVGNLALVVAMSVCGSLTASPPHLKQSEIDILVREARAAGRKEAVFKIMGSDEDALAPTRRFLRFKSVVLATPLKAPVVARKGPWIVTSYVLRLDKVLRNGPTMDESRERLCTDAPKNHGQPLNQGKEILASMIGGTLEIQGVKVTVEAGTLADLPIGKSVLLVGWNCGDGVIELGHGVSDVFAVDQSGRVRYRGQELYPFAKNFLDLQTVSAIDEYLKSLR